MPTISRRDPSPSINGMINGLTTWLRGLATRLVAGALNMPAPLLHDTGIFVFARVQAVESSVGKRLCPIRLWRQFRNWRRSTRY
jgi:hypothetical protein